MKTLAVSGHIKNRNLWLKSKNLKKNTTCLYMPLRTNTWNSANVTTFYLSPITKKNGMKCFIRKAIYTTLLRMSGTNPTITARSSAQSASVRSAVELKELREVKTMKYKKYLPVFKRCGWNVNVSDNEIEIENWSPAGENIVEYLDKNIDIPSQIQNIADNFDADEHAEMWIEHRGKNGVPGSIRMLLNDADAIQEMYNELAHALKFGVVLI